MPVCGKYAALILWMGRKTLSGLTLQPSSSSWHRAADRWRGRRAVPSWSFPTPPPGSHPSPADGPERTPDVTSCCTTNAYTMLINLTQQGWVLAWLKIERREREKLPCFQGDQWVFIILSTWIWTWLTLFKWWLHGFQQFQRKISKTHQLKSQHRLQISSTVTFQMYILVKCFF